MGYYVFAHTLTLIAAIAAARQAKTETLEEVFDFLRRWNLGKEFRNRVLISSFHQL